VFARDCGRVAGKAEIMPRWGLRRFSQASSLSFTDYKKSRF
jgi:hypothetical protein